MKYLTIRKLKFPIRQVKKTHLLVDIIMHVLPAPHLEVLKKKSTITMLQTVAKRRQLKIGRKERIPEHPNSYFEIFKEY